jgi:hypothetical protein
VLEKHGTVATVTALTSSPRKSRLKLASVSVARASMVVVPLIVLGSGAAVSSMV